MIREISVEELETMVKPVLIDVRSESEFSEATIPGAINLPLFNDAERAEIGTIYVQHSPALARKKGLELVSPKLPALIGEIEKIAGQGMPVIFCWRGGMRSKSLAVVLDMMGMPAVRLAGGYKSFRRRVVDYFARPLSFQVVVLRGNTGVGKTTLLHKLREGGYPAIDLEGMANNRGSVFGAIGLNQPPTQKTFESALFTELQRYKTYSYIIVECESRRIGRINLPSTFYEAMQMGEQILVYDTLEHRINRLLEEYTPHADALMQIEQALERLVKKLGHRKINELKLLLNKKELSVFTEKMLTEYYDVLYAYPNEPCEEYSLSVSNEKPEQAIIELTQFLRQQ